MLVHGESAARRNDVSCISKHFWWFVEVKILSVFCTNQITTKSNSKMQDLWIFSLCYIVIIFTFLITMLCNITSSLFDKSNWEINGTSIDHYIEIVHSLFYSLIYGVISLISFNLSNIIYTDILIIFYALITICNLNGTFIPRITCSLTFCICCYTRYVFIIL